MTLPHILYFIALTSFMISAVAAQRNFNRYQNSGEWIFCGLIMIPLSLFSAICFIYAFEVAS